MRQKKNSDIAIVCGTGSYNDLGMIRSCGEAGFNVIYLTNEKHIIPIQKSKYLSHTEYISDYNETDVIAYIDSVIKKSHSKVFIFPTADITAYYLDSNYSHFQGKCIFPNAKGKLMTLMDKSTMTLLAAQAGLTTPKTLSWNLAMENNYNSLSFPCIIKPAKSISGLKSDITTCKNTTDFSKAVEVYMKHGCNEVVIQDLINGENQKEIAVTGISYGKGDIEIHGFIEKKRIRGNGSTVYGSYLPDKFNPMANAISNFFKLTDYTGIFDMEFLVNNNGMYFIECNFRNGAYGYATTYAGFNMPSHIHRYYCGIKIQPVKIKEVVFMEERSDILNVIEKRISIWTWIKDIFTTDVFLFWNLKDPWPLFRVPFFIKRLFTK